MTLPIDENQKITLRLRDIIARIPERFLKSQARETNCELHFDLHDLTGKIARGRASVPLSKIVSQCPEIFRGKIEATDDMEIALPLQKLVEQIGAHATHSAQPAHAHDQPHHETQNHAAQNPAHDLAHVKIEQDSAPLSESAETKSGDEKSEKQSPPQTDQSPANQAAEPAPADLSGEKSQENPAPQNAENLAQPVENESEKIGGEQMISLALAPIFRLLPLNVTRRAPAPNDSIRIALPLRWIEPQLASGHVEIALDDFINAMPENLRANVQRAPDVRVWIPLGEIFQNLPASGASTPALQPSPTVQTQDHAPLAETPATKPNANETQQPVSENNVSQNAEAISATPDETKENASAAMTETSSQAAGQADEPVSAVAAQPPPPRISEKQIVDAFSKVPDIFASAVISGEMIFTSPDVPAGVDVVHLQTVLATFAENVRKPARRLGWTRLVTLYCEKFSVTASIGERAFLCLFHRERALASATHEALARVARELNGAA